MISIIICSRHQDISEKLRANILETIGVGIEYEIIIIDNSRNRYSIFSAYNKGVSLSSYPLLLFMHDDIYYRTNDWGVRLIDHFKDPQVGSVGVGGTHYLAYTPGRWWNNHTAYLYLLQSAKRGEEPELLNYFPENSTEEQVVVLDGVWICMRKELFDFIRFDEETYGGFHFYDLDITLQAYQAGYKILCVNDILIHHQSIGNFNQEWVKNALLFHNKWKRLLPVSVHQHSLGEQCQMEHAMLKIWMDYRFQTGSQKRAKIYRNALRIQASFRKGYLYYKTPFFMALIFARYFKNVLLRR
jgi:hypothetical protein